MTTNQSALITPEMKVATLLDSFPELETVLIELSPAFKKLRNPVLRKTVAKVATIERAAGMAGIPTRDLVLKLRSAVGQPSGTDDPTMAPPDSACGCFAPAENEPVEMTVKADEHIHTDKPPAWFCESCITQTIDAAAILATGQVPIAQVIQAAKRLTPSDILCVTVDFKPLPLIEMLAQQDFKTFCRQPGDNQFELFVAAGSGAISSEQSPATGPASEVAVEAATMSGHLQIDPARMAAVQSITVDLFRDVPMHELRQRFQAELGGKISASEFALSEQKIAEHGVSDDAFHDRIEELISLFKQSLAASAFESLPDWHPVRTFVQENQALTTIVNRIKGEPVDSTKTTGPAPEWIVHRQATYEDLRAIEEHYLRKEHLLFPYLERKGFTKPTTVMWRLHDEIRADIKRCRGYLESESFEQLAQNEPAMISDLLGMIFKEEHILYPTSLDMLSDDEWVEIALGESDIGYCLIDPPAAAPGG